MQTKELPLVSGIRRLIPDDRRTRCAPQKGIFMSKTASLGLASSDTLLGRLLTTLDRWLMTSARIAVRNGDLPYFGL